MQESRSPRDLGQISNDLVVQFLVLILAIYLSPISYYCSYAQEDLVWSRRRISRTRHPFRFIQQRAKSLLPLITITPAALIKSLFYVRYPEPTAHGVHIFHSYRAPLYSFTPKPPSNRCARICAGRDDSFISCTGATRARISRIEPYLKQKPLL